MDSPQAIAEAPIYSSLATEEDFLPLIEAYVEEMPERIDAILAAVSAEHWDALQRLAHQIKGSASGYGYATLSQSAAALEALLRYNRGAESPVPLANRLVDQCRRVRVAPS